MKQELFITCPSGLEALLVLELLQLGIKHVRKSFSGVYVPLTMDNVYLINYCSRVATRVLWPLHSFLCRDVKMLYGRAREIDWVNLLNPEQTFAIDANVKHPKLRHSLHAAQVVKDALCDTLTAHYGGRPSVDVSSPDVQFHLFIDKGHATISYDTSGMPLYKRGYRELGSVAPIQESLAAAILLKANYAGQDVFCDPCCGCGTFLIEAAMIATNTPAGYFRKKWAFMKFPRFSESDWLRVKEEADKKIIPLPEGKIFGADKDRKAMENCRFNLRRTGFDQLINVTCQEVSLYRPVLSPTLVVCNPPYGKRLNLSKDMYGDLEGFTKKYHIPKAFFLSPQDLNNTKKFSFFNGGSKVNLYAL